MSSPSSQQTSSKKRRRDREHPTDGPAEVASSPTKDKSPSKGKRSKGSRQRKEDPFPEEKRKQSEAIFSSGFVAFQAEQEAEERPQEEGASEELSDSPQAKLASPPSATTSPGGVGDGVFGSPAGLEGSEPAPSAPVVLPAPTLIQTAEAPGASPESPLQNQTSSADGQPTPTPGTSPHFDWNDPSQNPPAEDDVDGEGNDLEIEETIRHFSHFTFRDIVHFIFDGVPKCYYQVQEVQRWIPLSLVIVNFTLLLVGLSCVNFCVQTLPAFWTIDDPTHPLNVIEIICVAWFTFDLIVRGLTARNRKSFLSHPLNWVDFLSIVPSYVEWGTGEANTGASVLQILRVLRVARAVRVLKLSKHSRGLQNVINAVSMSLSALYLLGFLLGIILLIFSSAIYMSEQMEANWDPVQRLWIRFDGTVSPFQSVYHSMWFVMVTVTTVGYGDDFPYTPLGKVVSGLLMVIAPFVIAFPVVILSANFQDVVSQEEQEAAQLSRMGRQTMKDEDTADITETSFRRERVLLTAAEQRELRVQQEVHRELREKGGSLRLVVNYCLAMGAPERSIFLRNERTAFYSPLLMLECHVASSHPGDGLSRPNLGERRHALAQPEGDEVYGMKSSLKVNVGVRRNFPLGLIATFQLILHNDQVHHAVVSALYQKGYPSDAMSISPRKIRTMTVGFKSSHVLLQDAVVLTSKYHRPYGTVPVEVFIPKLDALPVLLRYSMAVSFSVTVNFEDGDSFIVDAVGPLTAGLSVFQSEMTAMEPGRSPSPSTTERVPLPTPSHDAEGGRRAGERSGARERGRFKVLPEGVEGVADPSGTVPQTLPDIPQLLESQGSDTPSPTVMNRRRNGGERPNPLSRPHVVQFNDEETNGSVSGSPLIVQLPVGRGMGKQGGNSFRFSSRHRLLSFTNPAQQSSGGSKNPSPNTSTRPSLHSTDRPQGGGEPHNRQDGGPLPRQALNPFAAVDPAHSGSDHQGTLGRKRGSVSFGSAELLPVLREETRPPMNFTLSPPKACLLAEPRDKDEKDERRATGVYKEPDAGAEAAGPLPTRSSNGDDSNGVNLSSTFGAFTQTTSEDSFRHPA